MIAAALVRPLTTTGVDELVVVPFPNAPTSLKPQHLPVPFANTAHECTAAYAPLQFAHEIAHSFDG